ASAASRLDDRVGAVDIGAKIDVRVLHRWNDVGARREVKHAFRIRKQRPHRLFADAPGDNFEPRVVAVLFQVAWVTDAEIVDDANRPPVGEQTIDQVAADEPSTPGYNVQRHNHHMDAPNSHSPDRDAPLWPSRRDIVLCATAVPAMIPRLLPPKQSTTAPLGDAG